MALWTVCMSTVHSVVDEEHCGEAERNRGRVWNGMEWDLLKTENLIFFLLSYKFKTEMDATLWFFFGLFMFYFAVIYVFVCHFHCNAGFLASDETRADYKYFFVFLICVFYFSIRWIHSAHTTYFHILQILKLISI